MLKRSHQIGAAIAVVLLAVIAGCGGGGSSSGNAPFAVFTVTPASGTTSTSFSFDASGSSDTEDAPAVLQVRWDWESNGTWTTYTTTKTATHIFPTPGLHLITLEVKDSSGLTTTTQRTVSVTGLANTAPTASFTVTPGSGNTTTSFTVNASASTDAEDPASALQVRWDWESNGTWTAYSTTKTASHIFATAGTYTITLEVKDTGGLTSTTTQTVTVTGPANTPPVASFMVLPASGPLTTSFAVDASASTDAEDGTAVLQVRWDWESNGTWTAYTTTKNATHSYATVGIHTITMEVKDSGGLTSTTSHTVTVTQANGPKLSLRLDASLNGDGVVKATGIIGAELLDTTGAVVGTATVNAGAAEFDLSVLSAGTYFIRLNNLANDLIPTRLDSVSANVNQYVGTSLVNSVIGTLNDPTYRIKTFSQGQGGHALVKFSNGTTAVPTRYAYTLLSLKTSPKKAETRVLGTGALLATQTSVGPHTLATWTMGSNGHGVSYSNGISCTGCHGNLDSHPASYASISESNGFCFKCHYSKAGASAGMVDPAQ